QGTRDFYPEDFRQRDWLFNKWKDAAALFGFEEYDAPVVEHEALYLRKAGDDISQQLYSFEDKGGRRLSLRPEMTPSLARMVLAHRGTLSLPLKWFSIPQCWRYERMSRGRRREHYQWNMDIWGVSSVDAEGELLSAAVLSLKQMGLTSADVGIKVVNSRLLLQNLFSLSGVKEDRFISTCLVVDRMGKLSESDFMAQLVEAANISVDQAKNLLILLNEKDVTQLPEMTSDIRDLFNYCASAGILDWVEFDASIVRGLSYYSGIVFEGFDRSGQLRALFGGGRYDNVLTTLGSTSSIPAVGFGFGDAVIMELLEAKGLLPSLAQSRTVQIVVVALSGEVSSNAITCAAALRDAQFSTELLLHDNKFKRTLQKANRLGAGNFVFEFCTQDVIP
ncbi:unnamed protein product, partial [Ectocarpus fasciculatus]